MTVSHSERQQATTRALAEHGAAPGALLPVLHAIQDALGYIPDDALDSIAAHLNLSRADVHGVISFYHDFKHAPPARRVLRLCRAEACQSMGGAALEAALRQRLGLGPDENVSGDGIALEAAYCFGACACAPNAMLDGELHGRLDLETLEALARGVAEVEP
ncbi:MAG: formate dehydrogenase subunit gamma [Proteobacteria bacterium]|jgi:formate dehydrogenase subunit gamma|nr:formate dehydrogenase subunit gamma [Pseudomonadota bacterium]